MKVGRLIGQDSRVLEMVTKDMQVGVIPLGAEVHNGTSGESLSRHLGVNNFITLPPPARSSVDSELISLDILHNGWQAQANCQGSRKRWSQHSTAP